MACCKTSLDMIKGSAKYNSTRGMRGQRSRIHLAKEEANGATSVF